MHARDKILKQIFSLQKNLSSTKEILKKILQNYKEQREKETEVSLSFFAEQNSKTIIEAKQNKTALLKLTRECLRLLDSPTQQDPIYAVIWRLDQNAALVEQDELLKTYLSAFFSTYFIYNTKLTSDLKSSLAIIPPYADAILIWQQYLLNKKSLTDLNNFDCKILNWLYPLLSVEEQTTLKTKLFSDLVSKQADYDIDIKHGDHEIATQYDIANKIAQFTNFNDEIIQNYIKGRVPSFKKLAASISSDSFLVRDFTHFCNCLKILKNNLTQKNKIEIVNELIAIPLLQNNFLQGSLADLLLSFIADLPKDLYQNQLSTLVNQYVNMYANFAVWVVAHIDQNYLGTPSINWQEIASAVAKNVFKNKQQHIISTDCNALLKLHQYVPVTLRAGVMQSALDHLYNVRDYFVPNCEGYFAHLIAQLFHWLSDEQKSTLTIKILNNIVEQPHNYLVLNSGIFAKLEKNISQSERQAVIESAIKNVKSNDGELKENAVNILAHLSHWLDEKQLPTIIDLIYQERLTMFYNRNDFNAENLTTMICAMSKLSRFLSYQQKQHLLTNCFSLLDEPSITTKACNTLFIALENFQGRLDHYQQLDVIKVLLKRIESNDNSIELYPTFKKYFFALDEGSQLSILNRILPRSTIANENALDFFIKLQGDWQNHYRQAAIPRVLSLVKTQTQVGLPKDMINEVMSYRP